MAHNRKRDASSLKITATAAGHLEKVELNDPAFVGLSEVIAEKCERSGEMWFDGKFNVPTAQGKAEGTTPPQSSSGARPDNIS